MDGIDGLLVRTVSQLNANSLPDPPKSLRFIGTASSGTDHLDNEYLEEQGIRCEDANGCNARAVAEYVLTSLLLWREQFQPGESFEKVGVIGVGKAGSAVCELLAALGIPFVKYDPPREIRDEHFTSASLEEVLDCRFLTFHVPLNKKGNYPTYHWLDEEKLNGRSFKLIINAARGGVIDEEALLEYFRQETVQSFVVDVWEGEPDFNPEVAENAFIATPHIAGYSEQAKINATKIVCDKMADFFEIDRATPKYKNLTETKDLAHIQYTLTNLLTRLHPIKGYDAALRDLIDRPDKAILFRNLRNEWPYRFEFPYIKIRNPLLKEFSELKKLGVQSI